MFALSSCQPVRTLKPTTVQWICYPCIRKSLQSQLYKKVAPILWETRNVQTIPLRKQLKDEAKERRAIKRKSPLEKNKAANRELDKWELTVGIEVHAQLNTERKLFSRAATSIYDDANSHVALFDLAIPGSQPEFQKAILLPALRAAIVCNCSVQRRSTFDRKHYFYQDQPAGYQITQYYEPFAIDGHITLYDYDGIAPEDGNSITIGIKQIQMEQDTAKTIQQPSDVAHLDFNRVGHPLIEIITLPQIHHPQTAAATVRKIQSLLQSVNAVTTGMEMGGLRADVNVSVRPRNSDPGLYSYHGVTGLGQRTEIKNLSSLKAIEDAIVAERDRQVKVLEADGLIEGETRGWTLGSTETRKLRGKEGEVDYRYMPDPDIPPLIISQNLIDHLKTSLPPSPDHHINRLITDYEISIKDAKTLVILDAGERLDYFDTLISLLSSKTSTPRPKLGKTVANWIIHELGAAIASNSSIPFNPKLIPINTFAAILEYLLQNRIIRPTARHLLALVYCGDKRPIPEIIEAEGLWAYDGWAEDQYAAVAKMLMLNYEDMANKAREGQKGKLMWLVGKMVREGGGDVDPERAKEVLSRRLGLDSA